MKTHSWLLNRQVLSTLCAAPFLLSSAFANAGEAAPAAEATPAVAAAPAEPASDFTYTFNLGLYSAYQFRGVETADGPALQGGFDIGHSSGFYAGTWWSNINPYFFGKDVSPGARGNHLETDWYAGWAKSFENGLGVNFLANYYIYPEGHKNSATGSKFDTFEVSAALSYKWLTYTYYYTPTDYYGTKSSDNGDTEGAEYHEIKAVYPLPFGGFNLKAKVGYTKTDDLGAGCGGAICDATQGDFAIGINKDFAMPGAGTPIKGFNAGFEYTDTFSTKNEAFYTDFNSPSKDLNEKKVWFHVKRTW